MSLKFREFSNHPSSIWEIKIELMKNIYIYGIVRRAKAVIHA